MTTIAATRTHMAADTLVYLESTGTAYRAIKVRKHGGRIFGAAGDAGDCTRFLDWAESNFAEKKRPKFSVAAGVEGEAMLLMLDKDGIHIMTTDDPYPEQVAADFYAIGSGGDAALGALYAGATLDKAMEIACAVNPHTREPITVLALDDK